jgi:hypothetical protein
MESIIAVLLILRLVVLGEGPDHNISWLFNIGELKVNLNFHSGRVYLFSHRFGSWCTYSFCVSFLLSFRWPCCGCQCRDAGHFDLDVRWILPALFYL